MYLKEKLTIREIAKKVGFRQHASVYYWLLKYNIPRRPPGMIGRKHTKESKRRMSETRKRLFKEGKIKHPFLGKKNPKASERMKGSKNPMWKGGITRKYLLFYASSRWRRVRKLILERDNYTCQLCGKTNCELHVHHINPTSLITLCKSCHGKVHRKYYWRKKLELKLKKDKKFQTWEKINHDKIIKMLGPILELYYDIS